MVELVDFTVCIYARPKRLHTFNHVMPPLLRTPPKRKHQRRPLGSFPSPDDDDDGDDCYYYDKSHGDHLGSFPGSPHRQRKRTSMPSSSHGRKPTTIGSAILRAALNFLNRFRRQQRRQRRPVTSHSNIQNSGSNDNKKQQESSVFTNPPSSLKRRSKIFHYCRWEKLDVTSDAIPSAKRGHATTEREEMLFPSICITPETGRGKEP